MCAILIEPFFCDTKSDCDKYNPEKLATVIVKGITGQTVSSQSNVSKPTVQVTQKYDTSIPVGANIMPIPGGYIESTTDGRLAIHKDRGNYTVIGKGFVDIYWNDNNGHGGSKRISG